MKDEIDENINKEFAELRTNTCSQLIHDDTKAKKAKSVKGCLIKRKLKSENYTNRLEAAQLETRISCQKRFRSQKHNVFTEEINKMFGSCSTLKYNKLSRRKTYCRQS